MGSFVYFYDTGCGVFMNFLSLFCGFHVYYSSSNSLPLLPTVPYCFVFSLFTRVFWAFLFYERRVNLLSCLEWKA